ncbi:unnamed protein product [Closterium sp. NIES-54]
MGLPSSTGGRLTHASAGSPAAVSGKNSGTGSFVTSAGPGTFPIALAGTSGRGVDAATPATAAAAAADAATPASAAAAADAPMAPAAAVPPVAESGTLVGPAPATSALDAPSPAASAAPAGASRAAQLSPDSLSPRSSPASPAPAFTTAVRLGLLSPPLGFPFGWSLFHGVTLTGARAATGWVQGSALGDAATFAAAVGSAGVTWTAAAAAAAAAAAGAGGAAVVWGMLGSTPMLAPLPSQRQCKSGVRGGGRSGRGRGEGGSGKGEGGTGKGEGGGGRGRGSMNKRRIRKLIRAYRSYHGVTFRDNAAP